MASEIRVNQIQNRSGLTTTTFTDNGVTISGILTVSENLNVGGVLTYEDVTNVDSVGIITARDDIKIITDNKKLKIGAGGDLELYHNGTDSYIANGTNNFRIGNTGSTNIKFFTNNSTRWNVDGSGHFVPDTDSQVDIGTNSVRVRNIYADTLYGSGANLTGITGTTINNNANNRVITGSGTANTLEGEANFTFNGTDVQVPDKINLNTAGSSIKSNQLRFQAGAAYIDNYSNGGDINFRTSVSSALDTTGPIIKSNGNIAFASGKGIDFSATSNPASPTGVSSELFEDYEEGGWTPSCNVGTVAVASAGVYVKVGRMVNLSVLLYNFSNTSSSSSILISGVPYACSGQYIGSVWLRRTNIEGLSYKCTIGDSGNSIINISYDSNGNGNNMGGALTYSKFAHSTPYMNITLTYQTA